MAKSPPKQTAQTMALDNETIAKLAFAITSASRLVAGGEPPKSAVAKLRDELDELDAPRSEPKK